MKAPTDSPKDHDLKPNQICVKNEQGLWRHIRLKLYPDFKSQQIRQHQPNSLFSLHLYSVAAPQASAAAVNTNWDVCWQRWFGKIHHVKMTAGLLELCFSPHSRPRCIQTHSHSAVFLGFHGIPIKVNKLSQRLHMHVASIDTCWSK